MAGILKKTKLKLDRLIDIDMQKVITNTWKSITKIKNLHISITET